MKRTAMAAGAVLIGMLALWPAAGVRADDNHNGHYVNGVEGIKGATLPPPGLYLRVYNLFYQADRLNDADGNEIKAVGGPGGPVPVDFDLKVFAFVPRLIWISDIKVLGGNLGADALIPLVYTDVELDPVLQDDAWGFGDIFVEPLVIAWHGKRWDAAAGLGVYIPTGDYDVDEPASPGKDFWTLMATLGGTVYFDEARTWSASILSRYETHSEKDETDVQYGDEFHFEWGIGKTIAKFWDVGLAGYCHWQISDDSGDEAVWDRGAHDQVYAVGPEVMVFMPKLGLFASLRSEWEFEAEDRPEGNVTVLTLTKIL